MSHAMSPSPSSSSDRPNDSDRTSNSPSGSERSVPSTNSQPVRPALRELSERARQNFLCVQENFEKLANRPDRVKGVRAGFSSANDIIDRSRVLLIGLNDFAKQFQESSDVENEIATHAVFYNHLHYLYPKNLTELFKGYVALTAHEGTNALRRGSSAGMFYFHTEAKILKDAAPKKGDTN